MKYFSIFFFWEKKLYMYKSLYLYCHFYWIEKIHSPRKSATAYNIKRNFFFELSISMILFFFVVVVVLSQLNLLNLSFGIKSRFSLREVWLFMQRYFLLVFFFCYFFFTYFYFFMSFFFTNRFWFWFNHTLQIYLQSGIFRFNGKMQLFDHVSVCFVLYFDLI